MTVCSKEPLCPSISWGLVQLRIAIEIFQHYRSDISFEITSLSFSRHNSGLCCIYLSMSMTMSTSGSHFIYTFNITVIVIWQNNTTVRMRELSALRSSKSPGTSFVCDKKHPFDLPITCMRLQSQDNGVMRIKDQAWSVRKCWILSISGRAT